MEIKQYTLEEPIDQKRNHKKIRKYPDTNEDKNITCQNSQDVTKFRRKLKAVNAYTKNGDTSKTNNAILQLRDTEKYSRVIQKEKEGVK